jgi:hypothetical protein
MLRLRLLLWLQRRLLLLLESGLVRDERIDVCHVHHPLLLRLLLLGLNGLRSKRLRLLHSTDDVLLLLMLMLDRCTDRVRSDGRMSHSHWLARGGHSVGRGKTLLLLLLLEHRLLLQLLRFHPNVHRELLEAVLERRRVVVLVKVLGRPVQGLLEALGHLRQLLEPLLRRVGLALLQQVHDLGNHLSPLLVVLVALPPPVQPLVRELHLLLLLLLLLLLHLLLLVLHLKLLLLLLLLELMLGRTYANPSPSSRLHR